MSVLLKIFANYYKLYFKIQFYHWNVKGMNFVALHNLFEDFYQEFALIIDSFAEEIVIMEGGMNLSLEHVIKLSNISNPKINANEDEILQDLCTDYKFVIQQIKDSFKEFADNPIIQDSLIEDVAKLQKQFWMLKSHLE